MFVSLYLGEELRGCLGHLDADKPLGRAVAEMAVAAAREDPRFPPVTEQELGDLSVEISVLSTPEPAPPEDVVPGRDGVLVRRGARQGVFLPQVATEQSWNRETLLTMVCRKAGLPDGAWRDRGCDLLVFRTQVLRRDAP